MCLCVLRGSENKQPLFPYFVVSVRASACSNSIPTVGIFMKVDISVFFEYHQNLRRLSATLHANRHTFLITSRSVILITRNVSHKICTENQNTRFVFCNFFPKIVPFMRLCWKILFSGTGHRWQYSAYALPAGYLRLQTPTQNVQYPVRFHFNNGYRNAPHCYVHCLSYS